MQSLESPMTVGIKPKQSLVGIELVRLLAYEGDRIFTTDRARELVPRVGLKDAYLVEALYHLRRNNWIVSLRRGAPRRAGRHGPVEYRTHLGICNQTGSDDCQASGMSAGIPACSQVRTGGAAHQGLLQARSHRTSERIVQQPLDGPGEPAGNGRRLHGQ